MLQARGDLGSEGAGMNIGALRRAGGLTIAETRRLTLFRHTYTAERLGFTPVEARRLAFLRWLRDTGRWSS
jgi:hypothetical protein